MLTPRLHPTLLSGWPSPGSVPVAPATAPPRPEQSWQQVHQLLAGRYGQASSVAELGGLSVYYYCVHQAFGEAQAAVRAQQLFGQLVHQLALPGAARQLDHACTAAWLSTRLRAPDESPSAPGPLAGLDQLLRQRAQQLLAAPAADSRWHLLRVLRYFSLRPPAAGAPALGTLLPAADPAGALVLGLAQGLTAELLTLIRLHRAGLHQAHIAEQVRQGVRQLLATRRGVDFAEQQFAVFPYEVPRYGGEPLFDAELSWRQGDLGPAWLLYEAHGLLHDAELARIAELVGLNTLLRTSQPATQVASAQFYRGAAGLAHLYGKLYQASGQQPAYHGGYVFWLGQTQHWLGQELATSPGLPRTAELLEGLGGVGLVLLAAVVGSAPDWDEVLL
jgi:hypothetical protein